jgi:hypothetical protein
MTVDTKSVTGRRELQFASFPEILADLDQIQSRPQKSLGNFSVGQICDHVARGMTLALDGPPVTVPWFMRFVGSFFKNRIINGGPMPAGFKLPKTAQKELFSETPIPDADGIASLRSAVQRTMREPQRAPHGVFGPLTREESDKIHLRHAAMHLSFIVPE